MMVVVIVRVPEAVRIAVQLVMVWLMLLPFRWPAPDSFVSLCFGSTYFVSTFMNTSFLQAFNFSGQQRLFTNTVCIQALAYHAMFS